LSLLLLLLPLELAPLLYSVLLLLLPSLLLLLAHKPPTVGQHPWAPLQIPCQHCLLHINVAASSTPIISPPLPPPLLALLIVPAAVAAAVTCTAHAAMAAVATPSAHFVLQCCITCHSRRHTIM
jgi:cytochrome c553